MSTPAASTKSVSSKDPEVQGATVDKQSGAPETQGQPRQNGGPQEQQESPSTEPSGGYPEQKHAGAVGLGPEYGKTHQATLSDKVAGLKDEALGKITHNQEKAQHGKEQRTGELKRKQLDEQDTQDPFNKAEDGQKADDHKEDEGKEESRDEEKIAKKTKTEADAQPDQNRMDEDTDYAQQPGTGNTASSSVTGKRGPGTHPTEAGAQEQAATVAPEGTAEAEKQRRGETTYADKQIDEGQHSSTNA